MTVVPAGVRTALMICDRCGTEDVVASVSGDQDLVWPLVSDLGWSGSPFATGAHRCPRCSVTGDGEAQPVAAPRGSGGQDATFTMRTEPGGIAVITPSADLDTDLSDRLRDDLMRAAARYPHVVIDMHAVTYLDSGSLGLLVRARQEARQHGATFDLVAPSRFVLTVLHTMKLYGVFRVFPVLAEALEAIRATDRPLGAPPS